MDNDNSKKGDEKRPPRSSAGTMTSRRGASSNRSRSVSNHRSGSNMSIGSRSFNSRTVDTVSTTNSGNYHSDPNRMPGLELTTISFNSASSKRNTSNRSRRSRSRSQTGSRNNTANRTNNNASGSNHGRSRSSTRSSVSQHDEYARHINNNIGNNKAGYISASEKSQERKSNRSKSGHRSSSRKRSSLHATSTVSSGSSSHRSKNSNRQRSCSRQNSSSRQRSSSRHSGSRQRSSSRQSTGASSSGSGDRSIPIHMLPNEIEPNVHHNAIMSLEIDGPVIAEMKENEMFARQAGINFTKEGGDYLTLVSSNSGETRSIESEDEFQDIRLTPNEPDHQMLFNDRELSSEDGANGKQLLRPDQDWSYLHDVAGQLFVRWKGKTSPALARRLRDFQFAQEKRRKKFGNEKPWGILGLYEHLAAVRADIEWAEDAACRRANGEPYKAWFQFVEGQGTGKDRPFFTYIALALCTGFLFASIGVNNWKVEPFSVNPMIGPSAQTLVAMGAKDSMLIVEGKEIWRLLSPMVLHAGFIHYLLNMLALWFIGSAVEQCHGFFQSLLLFVVPAFGGSLLSAIFLPEYITVGASAGIFGLIGACLADICMNWALLFNGFVNGDNTHRHTVVLLVLFMDIVVNSLIGLTPFVDNFAHLGGMLFGFLCGTSTMSRVTTDMFGDHHTKTFCSTLKRNVFRFFGIILTVLTMCTSLVILMNGDGQTSPCKSCDALSCMPFPPWTPYDNKWWYCDDCGAITADARINPETTEFDQLTLHCPGGDRITLDIDENEFETDRAWLEKRLPKLCRSHCPNVEL